MFTKRIIPCLDVHNGRVVQGTNFIDLKDAGDPVEVGAAYGLQGADELVFLDITASSDARAITLEMVRRVAETVFIPFTVHLPRCSSAAPICCCSISVLLLSAPSAGHNCPAETMPYHINGGTGGYL